MSGALDPAAASGRVPGATAGPARRAAIVAWSLFAAGLALRLLGLPFNGQHDLGQMVVDWGGGVREIGLGRVFLLNYGVFSYAVLGVAFQMAEHVPRFWWAPYKLFEIASEILILIALLALLPPGRRRWALVLYWINPWFALHGGWQGFWDGPHTFAALLAVLCARRVREEPIAWIVVGVALMSAAMFKPQGLFYFVVPVGLYALFRSARARSVAAGWYVLGVTLVLLFATGLLLLNGGSLLAIPLGYLSASAAMPNLCNGCLSVWRPIAGVVLALMGQDGPTWALKLPRAVLSALNLAVLAGVLTLIGVFAWKSAPPGDSPGASARRTQLDLLVHLFGVASFAFSGVILVRLALGGESAWVSRLLLGGSHAGQPLWPLVERLVGGRCPWAYLIALGTTLLGGCLLTFAAPRVTSALEAALRHVEAGAARAPGRAATRAAADPLGVLEVLAFASLVIPQLGTSAHINHTYAGLVLLIPLALANRRIALAWAVMTATHFYSHLSSYGLGLSSVIPSFPTEVPLARSLIARMDPGSHAGLLAFQAGANRLIAAHLPHERLIMVLSGVNFVCTLVIVRELFAGRGWGGGPAAGGPPPDRKIW